MHFLSRWIKNYVVIKTIKNPSFWIYNRELLYASEEVIGSQNSAKVRRFCIVTKQTKRMCSVNWHRSQFLLSYIDAFILFLSSSRKGMLITFECFSCIWYNKKHSSLLLNFVEFTRRIYNCSPQLHISHLQYNKHI